MSNVLDRINKYKQSDLYKQREIELEKSRREQQEKWNSLDSKKSQQSNSNFFTKTGVSAVNTLNQFAKGFLLKGPEKIIDTTVGLATSKASPLNWILSGFNKDKMQNIQNAGDEFIKVNRTDSVLNALGYNNKLSTGKTVQETVNNNSFVKSDNILGQAVEGAAENLFNWTTPLSAVSFAMQSYGGSLEQGLNSGLSRNKANLKAGINTGVEFATEKIYQGLGSALPKRINTKKLGIDEVFKNKVLSKISNKFVSKATELGVGAVFEGGEEVASDLLNPVLEKLAGLNKTEWNKLYSDSNFMDSFLSGAISSTILGGMQVAANNKSETNRKSLSNNEKKLVDLITDEEYKSSKFPIDKKILKQNVEKNLREGKIEQSKIDSIIGNSNITKEDTILDTNLNNYNKKISFQYEKTNNEKLDSISQSAVLSGMNNTRSSKSLVDFVSKLSTDTNTSYKFVNDKQIKEMGYSVKDASVNGLIDKNGNVLINVQSKDYMQKIIGHETTHLFEGTKEYDELQQSVINYAKKNGIYEERINKLNELYKDTNSNIDNELTSDLCGELLFTDENYVKNLSKENPNLFKKIYNFISDLIVRVKGTNQEKQLIEIKNKFNKMYNNEASINNEVKYHVSKNISKDIDNVLNNIYETNPVKLRDYTPKILVDHGIKDLEMYENPSHIRKNILTESEAIKKGVFPKIRDHYHGLGKDLYIKAIDSLDNPRVIFKNSNNKDYLILTVLKDNNKNNIIIPIQIETTTKVNKVTIDINRIKSVYGYETINNDLNDYIKYNLKNSSLKKIYEQKKEPGTGSVTASGSNKNISQQDTNVKSNILSNNSNMQKEKNNTSKGQKLDFLAQINNTNEIKKNIFSLGKSDSDNIIPKKDFLTTSNDILKKDYEDAPLLRLFEETRLNNEKKLTKSGKDLEYIDNRIAELRNIANKSSNSRIKEPLFKMIQQELKEREELVPKKYIPQDPTKELTYNTKEEIRKNKEYRDEMTRVSLTNSDGYEVFTKKNVKTYDNSGRLILKDSDDNKYYYDQVNEELFNNSNNKVFNVDVAELIPVTEDYKYFYDRKNDKLYNNKNEEVKDINLDDLKQETITKEQARVKIRKEKTEEYRDFAATFISEMRDWKDKSLISQKTTTMKRNLRNIMDDSTAKDIYNNFFKPISINEAKIQKEISEYNEKINKLNLNNKESIAVQMVGEYKYNPETLVTGLQIDEFIKKNNLDYNRISKCVEVFRNTYDELFKRVNEEQISQGFKEVDYREGYFPHFQDVKGNNWFTKLLAKTGWRLTNDAQLPTDIAGMTEAFKPGQKWASFTQHREGKITDFNALKGFDNYIRGAMDKIHHTKDVQRLRALENEIRYQHSDKGVQEQIDKISSDKTLDFDAQQNKIDEIYENSNNDLANFVTNLRDYTNNIAGKKASIDRGVEAIAGRKIYSVMSNIQNRVSANMVGLNISSALTNFIPITQAWGQCSTKNMLKAITSSITSNQKKDELSEMSTYLTNRTKKAENLYKTGIEKFSDKAGLLFNVIDDFTSNVIVRSKYYDNLENGMNKLKALDNADEFAKDVMGGRGKGDEPTVFNAKNPVVKLVTAFQLEINNQYQYLFNDVPDELKKEGLAKLTGAFLKIFLGAWIYNKFSVAVTGRKSAFSPIDVLEEVSSIANNENLNSNEKISKISKNVVEQAPFFGGLLGGGRLPISSALPDVSTIVDSFSKIGDEEKNYTSINNLIKEFSKPLFYVSLPFGGGQIKKTLEGISMYAHEIPGSYTNSGKLRFTAPTDTAGKIQAGLFGQYASKNAREYFDRNESPLTEKQQKTFKNLDAPLFKYWDIKNQLKNKKISEQIDIIGKSDFSDKQKTVLATELKGKSYRIDNYNDYGSYEEYDYYINNPDKYKVISNITNYSDYSKYKSALESVRKNSKNKQTDTINYINKLNLSIAQKAMFIKQYYPSFDQYDDNIYKYVSELKIDNYDKRIIFKELKIN